MKLTPARATAFLLAALAPAASALPPPPPPPVPPNAYVAFIPNPLAKPNEPGHPRLRSTLQLSESSVTLQQIPVRCFESFVAVSYTDGPQVTYHGDLLKGSKGVRAHMTGEACAECDRLGHKPQVELLVRIQASGLDSIEVAGVGYFQQSAANALECRPADA